MKPTKSSVFVVFEMRYDFGSPDCLVVKQMTPDIYLIALCLCGP
ncbi:MAG: hypothetical protein AAF664_19540 [Planctomycetota bacterium]